MKSNEKQAWAVSMLQTKYAETGRLPMKSDFDVVTLSRIKAFLGPWPRALEKAGLKNARPARTNKNSSAAGSSTPTSRSAPEQKE